jgi:hypothetical protein
MLVLRNACNISPLSADLKPPAQVTIERIAAFILWIFKEQSNICQHHHQHNIIF